ncbi:hypothetical protein [Leclercia adecarboxylata]|uniref:hypothetical protein n=1 Tax=Leclercia adecarboxylata TaxID=83655 RepID=UPI00215DBCA4|nr:hypothetical protein [Leclercia adecarboxylata]
MRVRAINAGGASSLWATSVLTHLKGRAGDVPKPANFRTTPLLWGVQLTGIIRLVPAIPYRRRSSIPLHRPAQIRFCLPGYPIRSMFISNWA